MKSYCLPVPNLNSIGLHLDIYNTPRFLADIDHDPLHSIFVYKSTLIAFEKISAKIIDTNLVVNNETLNQIYKFDNLNISTLRDEVDTYLPITAIPLIHLFHHVTGSQNMCDSYEPEICMKFQLISKGSFDCNTSDPSIAVEKFTNLLLNLPRLPNDISLYSKGNYKCLNHMSIDNQGYFIILPCVDPFAFKGNEKYFELLVDLYKNGELILREEISSLNIEFGYSIDMGRFHLDYDLFSVQATCRCISYFLRETEHGLACEHSLSPHYYLSSSYKL